MQVKELAHARRITRAVHNATGLAQLSSSSVVGDGSAVGDSLQCAAPPQDVRPDGAAGRKALHALLQRMHAISTREMSCHELALKSWRMEGRTRMPSETVLDDSLLSSPERRPVEPTVTGSPSLLQRARVFDPDSSIAMLELDPNSGLGGDPLQLSLADSTSQSQGGNSPDSGGTIGDKQSISSLRMAGSTGTSRSSLSEAGNNKEVDERDWVADRERLRLLLDRLTQWHGATGWSSQCNCKDKRRVGWLTAWRYERMKTLAECVAQAKAEQRLQATLHLPDSVFIYENDDEIQSMAHMERRCSEPDAL